MGDKIYILYEDCFFSEEIGTLLIYQRIKSLLCPIINRKQGRYMPKKISHRKRRDKEIHYNKVTETSKHYKYVKNFMGTEIFMSGIKDRKF